MSQPVRKLCGYNDPHTIKTQTSLAMTLLGFEVASMTGIRAIELHPDAPNNLDAVIIDDGLSLGHFAVNDFRHVIHLLQAEAGESMTLPRYGSLSITGERFWLEFSGYHFSPSISKAECAQRLQSLLAAIESGGRSQMGVSRPSPGI